MKLIRGIHNLSQAPQEGCVLTIGNFDGVHRGHRALLQGLQEEGRKRNLPVMVMLFEPQPLELFATDKAPARLTRLREKLRYLAECGVDYVLCVRFDRRFAALTAQNFISDLLVKHLRVKFLAVGDDFRFGAGREGDFLLLQKAGMEIRRMLQTIRRRGNGLIRFVNSYREVSHLPQPLLKIYTSQELLTGVVRLMYREPNDLHLILPPKGQRLMADKDLIEQVLINLIKNARENDATDIRISAGLSSGERPYIRIEDNGTGIEQEVLDRIFIPFFTTKPTGSGIGLTISRQIMHLHRGTITVSSEPGKGSIFTLLFPGVF